MSRIFVSYTREFEEEVRALGDDLEQLGHEFWLDRKLSGGQDWWDSILGQIRECDVFLLALGPNTLDSTACQRELRYARELGKPVLPVIVGAGVSASLLPGELSRIHLIDYQAQDRQAVISLSRALADLPAPSGLPDPLPEPPPVPLSYLGTLAERVDALDGADASEQSRLLLELKAAMREPDTAQDARTLLLKLRRRRDLLASIADEIDELLDAGPPAPPDGTDTGAESPGGPGPRGSGRRGWLVAVAVVIAVGATALWYARSRGGGEAGPQEEAMEVAEPVGADAGAPAETAAGATITGTVIYAGRPVSEFSNAPAVIELLDTDTRSDVPVDVTYDENEARFRIDGVPSGQFTPFVRIESGHPFDRESGGDFYSRLSGLNEPIAVPPNTRSVDRDLEVVHVIRLKDPVDNQERRTSAGDPPEVLSAGFFAPSAQRFEWDPVPAAASYELRFLRMEGDERVESITRTTTGTTFEPELTVTPAGQRYQFTMTARDEQGNLVGNYTHYYRNGSGGWFEFVVVEGPP